VAPAARRQTAARGHMVTTLRRRSAAYPSRSGREGLAMFAAVLPAAAP
jgi:hypothetical protein